MVSILSIIPLCLLIKLSRRGRCLWALNLIPLTWPSYPTKTSAACLGMELVCQERGVRVSKSRTLYVGSASLESEDLASCLPTMRGKGVSLDSVPPIKQ